MLMMLGLGCFFVRVGAAAADDARVGCCFVRDKAGDAADARVERAPLCGCY